MNAQRTALAAVAALATIGGMVAVSRHSAPLPTVSSTVQVSEYRAILDRGSVPVCSAEDGLGCQYRDWVSCIHIDGNSYTMAMADGRSWVEPITDDSLIAPDAIGCDR